MTKRVDYNVHVFIRGRVDATHTLSNHRTLDAALCVAAEWSHDRPDDIVSVVKVTTNVVEESAL